LNHLNKLLMDKITEAQMNKLTELQKKALEKAKKIKNKSIAENEIIKK